MTRTTSFALAVSATVLLAVGTACTGSPAAESPPPITPVFKAEAVEWGNCQDFALTVADRAAYATAAEAIECGYVTVPVNHDRPQGQTAQVAVLRVPAKGEGEPIGSLVLNPGGPGQSGTQFTTLLASILAAQQSPVLEHFDLVGFDPRGVGASRPAVDCFTDTQREQDESLTMPTLLPNARGWTEQDAQNFARQCAESVEGVGDVDGGELLAHLGTRDTARDLDVLRQALDEEKLTYAGWSYGTRLGAVYAQMFPRNVRAMVLDGVMNPTQGTVERSVDQAAGFQGNFDAMAQWCAAEVAQCPLGPDPANASAVYRSIVQGLRDEPAPTTDGRELSYDRAVLGTIAGLYSSVNWPSIVTGLSEVAGGRGDALMALRDSFVQRDSDGSYGGFLEAYQAINCVDEDRNTPEQETAMRAAVARVAPIFADGGVTPSVSPCAAWPGTSTLGFPYADDVDTDVLPELLLVSVTGDPATPHAGALALAEQLRSPVLTVTGAQHGAVFVGGSKCVDAAATAYLVDLTLPPSDEACSL